MSRLTIPDQSQAPEESQEILSEIGQMIGFVPNIQRIMARSPHVLERSTPERSRDRKPDNATAVSRNVLLG